MDRRNGFTLVEIMIVVAIIGLLAAIAIPSFMKARTQSQKNACINNLRQIESAKEQWAVDTRKTNGVDCDTEASLSNINEYIKGLVGTNKPGCPSSSDAFYTYQPLGTLPTCSLADAPYNHVYTMSGS